jgi:predicted transcriptional regulator
VPLGLRVTKELKAKLDQAAEASGRSQSQEAEFRLESTFNAENAVIDALDLAYGRYWTGILLALAKVGQHVGTRGVFLSQFTGEGYGVEDWLSDSYAYDQVVRAVNTVLEEFRPRAPMRIPPDTLGMPPFVYGRVGNDLARVFLDKLQKADDRSTDDNARAVRERLAGLFPLAPMKTK